ncbi:hypothetical protein FDP41_006842 [Naegleria fowleri]|uniref:Uncharacterized protein n=1 Tax=Naegleria fowleri TaxID=5763 RepID=A0A6A5BHE8_NAEFO|nr:uncharacterized protein FDP41_006842 [Naegleria fowleri]KAF0974232.1 hypothetical protein FDP41_006842 [Naegleria fowleri]
MELENISIAAELSSSDPTKQTNALLILHRLYTAGKDIQNYVSTVINAVLVKSSDPLVKKLCYQLIKGCAITSRHDWNFVMKVIVDDMTNSSANPDLCVWAFRTVVGLCGIGTQLQEFFVKNRRQVEECLFKYGYDHVRIASLHFIKCLAISLRQSETLRSTAFQQNTSESSTAKYFADWVLRSIKDDNQEIAFIGFEILREFICGDCARHLHSETLPISVTKESMQWISAMKPYYHTLLSRLKCMDVRRRYPALRPLTYISLYLQDELSHQSQRENALTFESVLISTTNVLRPMLQSVECATVLETAHCILLTAIDSSMPSDLTACTNNLIDDAITAYLGLLYREESSFFYDDLMKDVCSVLNTVRDKYTVSVKLVEHIMKVGDAVNRMYILSSIVRTLIQCSINTRTKQHFLKLTDQLNDPVEIDLFLKEGFIAKLITVPDSPFEELIRNELLFCICREYLSQKPYTPSNNSEPKTSEAAIDYSLIHAWLDVGIGISEFGMSSFTWKFSSGLTAAISEFSLILTDLCGESYMSFNTNEDQRKKIQKILNKCLDIILKMKTEFAEIISMCILSNFVELQKQAAGRESGDLVFDHTRFMISSTLKSSGGASSKEKIETLLYCLLSVCLRFTPKLRDTHEYLRALLEKQQDTRDDITDLLRKTLLRVDYAMKYNITKDTASVSDIELIYGKVFNKDHPIFKSYFAEDDEKLLTAYIEGIQQLNTITANLHEQDLYQLKKGKQLMTATSTNTKIRQTNTEAKFYSLVISQPSDPICVTASYSVIPESYTAFLHVKIHNTSPCDIFQTSVEVGMEGPLTLFEKTQQASNNVGDLAVNQSYEFDLEFTMTEFGHYCFNIIVKCTHLKSSGGIDLLDEGNKQEELVTIRCTPFKIKMSHVLSRPINLLHQDFLTLWENFESSFHLKMVIPKVEGTGKEKSPILKAKEFITNMMSGLHFAEIPQLEEATKLKQDGSMWQLCFAARSIFKDYILLVVFGYEHHDGEHFLCDFQFKTSSEPVYSCLHADKSPWFQEMVYNNSHVYDERRVFVVDPESYDKSFFDITNQFVFDKVRVNVMKKYNLNSAKLNVLFLKRWKESTCIE